MGKPHSKTQSLKEVLNSIGKDFRDAGAYVFKEFERFLLEGRDSITIVLVGKTGVGKSRLVNALIGNFKATEGQTLRPETMNVASFKTEKHGVTITVWDTPGVQDGSGHEDEYLKQISENVKDVDLLLYCVAMNGKRFGADDSAALAKVVDKFGTEIWKKAMIVLTLANEVMPSSSYKGSSKMHFEEKLKQFTDTYQEHLKSVGVKDDVPCTPVGDIGQQELPICEDWLPVFWLMAFRNVKDSAKSAMLKANYDRIKFPSLQEQENKNTEDDEFIVRLNEEQEKTLWEIVEPLACRTARQGVKASVAIGFGIGAPIGGAAGFIYGAVRGLHEYLAEKKLRSDMEKEQEASEVTTQSESGSKAKPKLKLKPKLPDSPDPKGQSQTDVDPDLSSSLSQPQMSTPTKVALPTKPKSKVKPKPDLSRNLNQSGQSQTNQHQIHSSLTGDSSNASSYPNPSANASPKRM